VTLFSTFQAAARSGDLETSHEAARSVKNTASVRAAILRILEHGPHTDEQIAYRYENEHPSLPMVSPSGLRSRRAELVDDGQVVDSGERRKTTSGRNAICWRLAQ
jgi:hypothetical protein